MTADFVTFAIFAITFAAVVAAIIALLRK